MRAAFRIERFIEGAEIGAGSIVEEPVSSSNNHKEIMAAIEKLQNSMANGVPAASAAPAPVSDDGQSADLDIKKLELLKLKDEMRSIYQAIDETKTQILTIKENGSEGREIARVAEELSLIVKGTEDATDTILQSAEMIDNSAANLIASLSDESQQAMALEVQENVVAIFEACNFQDLTGQRITKVVKTFCFIEQRLMKMMEIWGGPEEFLDVETEELEHRAGDKGLLNGPAQNEDADVASQDDIDALFD